MEPGAALGPYVIDRELGAGGMGTVYAATGPEGAVALKVVHAHLLASGDAVERFRREIEIGRTIEHPNVVRTFGGGEADGHHFLAMEFVEGQTLDELLRELERVPEELCRHIGREVCQGLGAIHAAGAVHRDLKPENVMITPDHVVKIMDLGVARSTDDALRLSQTGAFVGSLHYAAPEQFSGGGKGLDGRCDLHALGLVLYELATGVCPYYADAIPQVVRKVLHEEPRRLGEINPQLSAFFEEVVHCLLAKDRDARFATAGDLAAALEAGEDGAWWHARARALQLASHRPIRRVRIQRETAVYGREQELILLRSLFARAAAGDGQVVFVEGEAGIGKSRLVDELVGRLQQEGEDLNFLFGGYPPGGAATAEGGFSAAFREHFGEAGSAAHLPENAILVPAFDALLRGEGAPDRSQPLTPGSLHTCFIRATQSLARERTTIVLIDDLHFASEEGRALFTSLATAVPGHAVLLIGTTRPGLPDDWTAGLTRLDHAHHIALPRLGPKDLVRLLADTLKSESVADRLSGQIARKSDGNPFFVFEIIRGLREGQFITQQDDGTWVTTRVIDEIQIPSSVLDLVNARVADLTEEERDLLDVACCWGFEFDPGLIGDVLGLRRIPLLKTFGQIERRHRLVRASGRHYVFDHHQVQEALYGTLHEQMREEYHAALAEALAMRSKATEQDPGSLDGALCVDLCEHYLKGAQGESALRHLDAAQLHLMKGYVDAEAIALGERALAVPDLLTGTARANVLLRLAAALAKIGRPQRQEECAREGLRLAEEADDDELRVRALAAVGAVTLFTSRHTEAETTLRRAVELARARGDRDMVAEVGGGVPLALRAMGRVEEARELFVQNIALAAELGKTAAEARSTFNLALTLTSLGRFDEAEQVCRRALALLGEVGLREGQARATATLGQIQMTRGRLADARATLERALAASREAGDRYGEGSAVRLLGNLACEEGRIDDAQRYYERDLVLTRELRSRGSESGAIGNLGMLAKMRDRLGEATGLLEQQIEIAREVADPMSEAVALVNLGPAWHQLGDLERARRALERSLALCREIGARYPEGFALLGLAAIADETGDTDEALRIVQDSLALRRDVGHLDGVADALLDLGELLVRTGRTGDSGAADAADTARAALEEALVIVRDRRSAPRIARANCLLALLGDDTDAARAAIADDEAAQPSIALRLLVWQATRDREQLRAAKRRLDDFLTKNPPEYHDAIRRHVRANREMLNACEREGIA